MSARWGATPDEWFEFSTLLSLGEDLLPVVSNLRAQISPNSSLKKIGKVPSRYGKSGLVIGVPDWTGHHATFDELLAWEEQPDYGISVICRVAKPVDIDVPDVYQATQIQHTVSTYLVKIGVAFAPVRTRKDSGKRLMLLRVNAETPKVVVTVDGGIVEFLGNKQQFIAAGTHEDGARYEWEGLGNGLPLITLAEYNGLIAHVQQRFGIAPLRKEKEKKAVKDVIDEPIYTKLVETNAILSHEDNGSYGIICPFAHEHTTESGDTGTVYFPAHTGGHARAAIKCLHGHCAHRQTHDFAAGLGITGADDFEVLPEELDERELAATGRGDDPHPGIESTFNFVLGTVFRDTVSNTDWVIKGLIPCASTGLIIGPGGAGKTFVALDLVGVVIRGIPWRGHKTKKGKVLYVVAEGENHFRHRLQAYCIDNNIENIDDVVVLAMSPNFMDKKLVKKFIKEVRALGIDFAWIIIDTLSQCMLGDENNGKDMGVLLANYKRIQQALNAAVTLIHHTGKNEGAGARGWSGLRSNTAYKIDVHKKGKGPDTERWVEIERQKDGADGSILKFALREVVVGVDPDGDNVCSMVVDYCEDAGFDEVKPDVVLGKLKSDILEGAQEFFRGNNRWPTTSELSVLVREGTAREKGKVEKAIIELVAKGALDPADDKTLAVPGKRPRVTNLEE